MSYDGPKSRKRESKYKYKVKKIHDNQHDRYQCKPTGGSKISKKSLKKLQYSKHVY